MPGYYQSFLALAGRGWLAGAGLGSPRRMPATADAKPLSTCAVNFRRGTPSRASAGPWSRTTTHAVPVKSTCHAQHTGSRAGGGSAAN